MRPLNRILAGAGVVMTTAPPTSAAMAAPAEVIKEDAIAIVTTSCIGGDEIFLEGTFHTVLKTSANGTIKQAVIHLKGTGTSGTRYVLNQTLQATFNDSADSGRSISVLVSLGRQPNEIAVFRWDSATSLDSVELVCRG